MATAPIPGAGRRVEEASDAEVIVQVTVNGETKHLAINNVPISEQRALYLQSGLVFEHLRSAPVLVASTALWWLARRADGEPNLSYEDAEAEFPNDLTADDIGFDLAVNGGNDPEV